jgi:RimJ/RimL family protein N-acetyltransferase
MTGLQNIFETTFVRLRPLQAEDTAKFWELTQEKDMWAYFTSDLSNLPKLENWVKTALSQAMQKTRMPFTIVEKANNKIIGSTSIGNISERDKRLEIGWTWLGKAYQGQGYNNMAKYLLLKHCFEELLFERAEFKTDVLNMPARKALLRIGCTEEGMLRSHTLMPHNRRRDTIYYSILKSEWEGIKMRNNWI